jgi:hypothetical protein
MKKQDRRKFLFTGISLAAVWAALRLGRPPEKKKSVKFLTQDGKLVEIEIDKVPAASRIASKSDIQQWIKK